MNAVGTVLIVDDDPDMRQLVRTILELTTRLECHEAADGLHALEYWLRDRHDFVILDQRMPRVSGLDVARAMIEADPEQVVILVSAYLEAWAEAEAERLGVRAVVAKDRLRELPQLIVELMPAAARVEDSG